MRAEAQLAGARSQLVPILPAAHQPPSTPHSSRGSLSIAAMQPSTTTSADAPSDLDNYLFAADEQPPLQHLSTLPPQTPTAAAYRPHTPELADTLPNEDPFGTDLDWIPDFQFPMLGASLHLPEPAQPLHRQPAGDPASDSLSAAELAALHEAYRSDLYHALPFLDFGRFQRELAADHESISILALSYSVALVGSTLLPGYRHLTAACYDLSRRYIEICERDEPGENLISLNLLQAMTFVVRHEITDRHLRRAYMTLGRAIRLMKVLGLHTQDSESQPDPRDAGDLGMCLPLSMDPLVLEERRRTFWILYILESYVTTRTGISGELGESRVQHQTYSSLSVSSS